MWKYIKWLFRGFGLILCIWGIGGIVEGIQIWEKWIELIFGENNIGLYSYINHDLLKYIFVFAGLLLLFICSGISKKIFGYRRKPQKVNIQFEYDENDKQYYYKKGAEQIHRIYIENMTGATIENTKVEITDMRPRHPVFTKQFPVLKSFDFSPGKEPIDVIRLLYKNKRELYELMEFETTMQSYFSVSDQGHEITTTISGNNIDPISRKFKFGIQRNPAKTDRFWFKAVD